MTPAAHDGGDGHGDGSNADGIHRPDVPSL